MNICSSVYNGFLLPEICSLLPQIIEQVLVWKETVDSNEKCICKQVTYQVSFSLLKAYFFAKEKIIFKSLRNAGNMRDYGW